MLLPASHQLHPAHSCSIMRPGASLHCHSCPCTTGPSPSTPLLSRRQRAVSATPVIGPLTSGSRTNFRKGARNSSGCTADQSARQAVGRHQMQGYFAPPCLLKHCPSTAQADDQWSIVSPAVGLQARCGAQVKTSPGCTAKCPTHRGRSRVS